MRVLRTLIRRCDEAALELSYVASMMGESGPARWKASDGAGEAEAGYLNVVSTAELGRMTRPSATMNSYDDSLHSGTVFFSRSSKRPLRRTYGYLTLRRKRAGRLRRQSRTATHAAPAKRTVRKTPTMSGALRVLLGACSSDDGAWSTAVGVGATLVGVGRTPRGVLGCTTCVALGGIGSAVVIPCSDVEAGFRCTLTHDSMAFEYDAPSSGNQ